MSADKELIEAVERLSETVNARQTGNYSCQVHPADVRLVLARLEALTRPPRRHNEIVDFVWQGLLDKDDRTSPEEYPEMCLIEREELSSIIAEVMAEAAYQASEALTRPLEGVEAVLRRIAELEPETMLSSSTDRYSGERTAYRTLDYEQVQEIARAALSPSPEAQPEPVAWLVSWREGAGMEVSRDKLFSRSDNARVFAAPRAGSVQPLYASTSCDTGKIGREVEAPSISTDGPHAIGLGRRWLARQLLDSMLTDAEAYGIVRHAPALELDAGAMDIVEKAARAACDDLGVNPDDWHEEDGVRTYAWQKEVSTVRAILAVLPALLPG